MHTDWHTAHPNEDRDPQRRAREAAEALFRTPAQPPRADAPPAAPGAPAPAGAPEQPAPRKPRIIAMPAPTPAPEPPPELAADATALRAGPGRKRKNRIPPAEHGRVRALASYGMTLDQVAEHYDAPLGEIEKIVGAKEGEGE